MESLIQVLEHGVLDNGEKADFITLHSGQLIALTRKSIAVYRSTANLKDPLGNGLIGLSPIPEEYLLRANEKGFVQTYRSGYVGLNEGMALLITPFKVSLFKTNDDALTGSNPLAFIELTPVDLR